MQAQLWAAVLTSQVPVPTSKPHYHLLQDPGSRITYGVDYSGIIATLGKDLGAAPALARTLWDYGAHVLVCYAFGAAMTPFYRLYGPFRDPGAKVTVKTEIWETITRYVFFFSHPSTERATSECRVSLRRGLLGNLFMGVIPMAFYAVINAIAFGVETVYCTATGAPRAI